MYIAVAGNIGSGKSTLTQLLAKHYGWEARYETVEENPYLEDYYRDIHRWSFNLEVFFLKERFRDLLEISKSNKDIIQDRTIYEGVYVFTENNHRMGNLDDRDYEAYMELFGAMEEAVKLPDLMIYLHSSVPHLVKNIQKRGRSFEQEIPIEYLQNLNDFYEEFIREKYKGTVLLFNVDDMDYEHVPKDFGKIIDKIDAEIYGLFSFNEK